MSMSCTTGRLCTTTSAARQTPDTPDVALVRSIAAGDKHAMRILFARHNVRVFRFVLRLVGDNSAAEDLVSEVFLDVWRQAGRFQGRSQVTTWLLAIARNKALSALLRRSTEELDDVVGSHIRLIVRDRLRLHSMRLLWVAARRRLSCGRCLIARARLCKGLACTRRVCGGSALCRAKWGSVSFSTASNPNSTVEQTISHTLQSTTQWSKKHSWMLEEPK
jgi:hypothetical protein